MTADEVIALRKEWGHYNFGPSLPAATLLAERDWLAYTRAMAASMPTRDAVVWPTKEEVAWAWPDGLVVVFSEPVELRHTIISQAGPDDRLVPTVPHYETQTLAGLAVMPEQPVPAQYPDGESAGGFAGSSVVWIATEPSDVITAWWLPGVVMHSTLEDGISESTRFLMSVLAALGHRLTKIAAPPSQGRGERRRMERELPGLRVLRLGSGATVRPEGTGTVEWQRQWIVRGHWRHQACGPKLQQRRLIWIDPFVKGPEDKPLDVRPTLWRTGHDVPDPEGR